MLSSQAGLATGTFQPNPIQAFTRQQLALSAASYKPLDLLLEKAPCHWLETLGRVGEKKTQTLAAWGMCLIMHGILRRGSAAIPQLRSSSSLGKHCMSRCLPYRGARKLFPFRPWRQNVSAYLVSLSSVSLDAIPPLLAAPAAVM
jgi:hypothetical protein